ncbi:MAG: helix-turn-helix domain-containing protein [Deltaproteobacteria bacterium]|nr:helix-turn-helix domain-containing protein [Deltaproteobacteria bacterium]
MERNAETGSSRAQDAEVVWTADDVARFLGVDLKGVYNAARRGEIPHRRIGRRVVFLRSALLDWLRSNSAPAARKGKP